MATPAQQIRERFPDEFLEEVAFRGETTAVVKPGRIVEIARHLKESPGLEFDQLSDVYGVDGSAGLFPPGSERFELVYLLNSITRRHRLRLKTRLAEERCEIDSVYPVWRAAGFLEREVYDLMGIRFRNHPDLRRIFLPDDFDGHPLRKEYPAEGKGWRSTFDFIPTEEPRT